MIFVIIQAPTVPMRAEARLLGRYIRDSGSVPLLRRLHVPGPSKHATQRPFGIGFKPLGLNVTYFCAPGSYQTLNLHTSGVYAYVWIHFCMYKYM